ncbi:DUF551 domain-containing protein [Escherichia coli]|nr:DUF551 domain-containing protein [Escherichia coli]EEQ6105347.1 DUF551 domain-containing protein [Escherichia coli]EES2674588.1 DUF551 domain-containing protein [Escherichia coli]EET0991150.1 DUF551 domain-containing protein [Escherichia coli]EET7106268.1 DUF551 domain-containing protein [Escherichia coli]
MNISKSGNYTNLCTGSLKEVTHWMPLPEPPKEVSQ